MRVVGLGAGGHGKVVIDALLSNKGVELVGLVDPDQRLWNTKVLGVPVLGDDGLLAELREQGVDHAFIGLGSVGDIGPRQRLYETAVSMGFQVVQAIHPKAVISRWAELGNGSTVLAGAIINAGAVLGNNVIVNTGAIIEHDCVIGDHVHVATGARLASTVRVGASVHIGAGATVIQCVAIGEGAVVGAGAAVVRDVEPWAVVAGVPARVLKVRRPKQTRGGNPPAEVAE